MPARLPKVTSYMKNLGKSIAFLTADEIKKMTPGVTEFSNDNEELFKSSINTVRNPKSAIKKVEKYLKDSNLIEPIKTAKKNAIESIKTGEFYSEKRNQEAWSDADIGNDMFEDDEYFDSSSDSSFDDISFDDDENEDFDDNDRSDSELEIANTNRTIGAITKSSASVSTYISKTIGDSAKAQSDVTVKTSTYLANVITGMSTAQIAKLDSLIDVNRTGFGAIKTELDKMNSNIQTITSSIDNSTKYYDESLKIFQESNAMLKELLEMQRNLYKTQSSNNDRESTYDKIVSYTGLPNLKEYGKQIINNTGFGGGGWGDMANMALSSMAGNPLSFILQAGIRGIMPKYFKQSIEDFDKTLSNSFGALINKINEKAEDQSSTLGMVANFLKVPIEEKKTVNTGKFNKGPVPFDGVTRQSIVEVIPSYLRRIEAALTRQEERFFDNNSGTWKTANQLKKDFNTQRQSAMNMATYDIADIVDDYLRSDEGKKKYGTKITKKQYTEGMQNFRNRVYQDNGSIRGSGSKSDENFDEAIRENSAYYNMDPALYAAVVDAINNDRKGRKVRLELSREVVDAKTSDKKKLEEIENDPSSIYRIFYNGDVENRNNKKNTAGTYRDFSNSNPLREYTDTYGHTVFDYLRSIDNKIGGIGSGNGSSSGGPSGGPYTGPMGKVDKVITSTMQSSAANDDYLTSEEELFDMADAEIKKAKEEEEKKKREKEFWKNSNLWGKIQGTIKTQKEKFSKRDNRFFEVFDLPFKAATNLIETANKSIYKFLFGDDYEKTQEEMDRDRNGLFGKINTKIDETLDGIKNKFNEFLDDPKEFLKKAVKHPIEVIKELFKPVKESAKDKVKGAASTVASDIGDMAGDAADFIKDRFGKKDENSGSKRRKIGLSGGDGDESSDAEKSAEKIIAAADRIIDRISGKVDKTKKSAGQAAGQASILAAFAKDKASEKVGEVKESASEKIGKVKESAGRIIDTAKNTGSPEEIMDKIKEEVKGKNKKKAEPEEPSEAKKAADHISATAKIIANEISDRLIGKDTKEDRKKATNIIGRVIKDITGDDKAPASIAASGLIGGGVSLIFGLVGGPLAGFAVGAGIDMAKRSKTLQELLFGNEEEGKKGVIPKSVTNFFEEKGINMRKGAIAGALASFVTPFGLIGGTVIGAGVGLLTTTNKFKEAIFGPEDEKGERHGGLVGAIQENIIDPMSDSVKEIATGAKDYFKDNILSPLEDFLNPTTQAMKNIGHSIKRSVTDGIKRSIGIPLQYTADKITSLVNNTIGKVATGAIKKAGQVVSIGPKALGKVGNRIRASQIKRGTAHDMSAEERLRFMDEHPELFKGTNTGIGTANKHFRNIQADMQIAGYSDEELQSLLDQTSSLYNFNDARAEQAKKQVNGDLYRYMKDNGILKKTGGKYYKRLAKAIADGDANAVEKILNDDKGIILDRGARLTKKEADAIRNLSMSGVKNIADLNNNIQTEDETMNLAFQQLQELYPNIKNRKQLDEFNRKLQGELDARKKGKTGNATTSADLLDENGNETVASKAAETVEYAIHQTADSMVEQLKTTNALLEYIAKLNAGEYSDFTNGTRGNLATASMEQGHTARQADIANNFKEAAETRKGLDFRYEVSTIKTLNDMQNTFDFDFKGVDFGRMDKKVAYKIMKLKKGKYNEEAIKYLCSLNIKQFNKIYDKLKAIEKIVDFQITDNEIHKLGELTDKQINILSALHKGGFKVKSLEDIQTILDSRITTPQIAKTTIVRAKNAGGVPDSANELIKFATAYVFDDDLRRKNYNEINQFSKIVQQAKQDIAFENLKKEAQSRPEVPELVFEHDSDYAEEASGGARKRRSKLSRFSKHGYKITYIDGEPADDEETKKGLEDDKTSEEEDKTNAEANRGILETTKDMFQRLFGDIDENKEKIKNKSSGVLSTIGEKVSSVGKGFKKILTFLGIAGAVFVASKSGLLTALGDFVKEKVWPPIKSFFTDTVGPWVTDTVLPWFTETAIPALLTGLIKSIPTIVANTIKGVLGIGNSTSESLDNSTIGSSTATGTTYTDSSGNTTSGSTTTSNSSTTNSVTKTIFGSRSSNEINYLTDEDGNLIKGYIDDDGNVVEDEENGSYIPVNNTYKTKSTSDNMLGRLTRTAGTAFTQGLTGTYKSANILSKAAGGISKVASKFGFGGKVAGSFISKAGSAADSVINAAGNIGSSITGASSTLKNSSVYNSVRDAKAAVDLGTESVSNAVSGIKSKIFGEAAEETAEAATKVATEAAEAAESSGIISGIKNNISKVVSKLFENNSFLNKVEQVAQWCGKSVDSTKLGKAILEWADNMVDKAGESGIKKVAASSGKAILTTIGELPIIDIVVGVVNFVSGWNNAGTIFSIASDDVTPLYRLVAGLLKVLEIVPYLGIVISIVGQSTIIDIFCSTVAPIFGFTDLLEKRENAQNVLDEWNAEHPEETYDNLEDYNHRNDVIYKAKKKVTKTVSNALTSVKNFIFGKKSTDDSEEEEAVSTAETEASEDETTGGKRIYYGRSYSGGAQTQSAISTALSTTSTINDSSSVSSNVSTAIDSIITAAKEGDLDTIQSISAQYSNSTSASDSMTGLIINSVAPMMTMNAVFNKVLGSINSGLSSFISGIGSVSEAVNANVSEAMSDIESGKATIFSKSTWTIGDYSSLGGIASVVAPMADLMQRISMTPVYTVKSVISTVLNSIGSIANLFTGSTDNSASSDSSSSSGTISSNMSSTSSTSSSSGGILSKATNTIKKLASLFTGGNRTGLSGGSGEGDHVYQESSGLKNMSYGNSTIGEKGCGPVAATNLLNSMGANANVADAANYAEANGFTNGAGTDMGYFGSYLGSKGIPTKNTFSPTEAEAALENGNKLVLLGDDGAGRNNGVYGKYSHFVTATGIDAKGRVKIEDPDLPQKNKYYNKNDVFNNMRGSVIVGAGRNSKLGKYFSGGSGTTAVDTVISTARAEVGTKESPSGSNKVKYNTEYYGSAVSGSKYPWCCAFIWWVFKHAGYSKLFYGGNKTASCQTAYDYYKSKGQTVSSPRKGDLIFYKYNGVSRTNHIGLISSVGNDGSITTIEGNTGGNEVNGGAVLERTRTISTSNIYGYARPDYTSAGDSAISSSNTTDTEVSDSTDSTVSTTSTESSTGGLLSTNYNYTNDNSSSTANENDIANLSSESQYKDSAYTKLFGGKRNRMSGKAKIGPDGKAYGNGAHFITANGIDRNGNVLVEDPDLPGEVYAYPKEEVFNNMRGSVIVGAKRNSKNTPTNYYLSGGASSSSYTGGELVCIKAKELGDYMVKYNQTHKTTSKSSNSKKAWHYRHKSSAGFGYTESAPKSFQASYKGNHASNCAYFASWALQCAGYLPVGTTVCHKNKKEPSGASSAKKYGCTLHYVNAKVGTLYKQDKIHPGDVLSIKTSGSGTMCVYAGWDSKNNRPMFYEGGGPFYGRNCRKKSAGIARNDYVEIGPMYIPYDANNVVYWIIRPSGTGNGCVDLSNYTGTSSMSGIKGNGKTCSAKTYSDALNNSTTGTMTYTTNTDTDDTTSDSDSTSTSSSDSDTIFTKFANAGTDMMKAIYGEDTYNALFGESTDDTTSTSSDTTSTDSSDSSSTIDTSDVSDVHYYTDGSEVMSNGKRTGKVTGGLKKNQKLIWDYLQQLGYSKRVAAGIMGNIFQESTYKPFKQQSMSDTKSLEYTNKIAKGNVSRDTFAGTKSAPTSKGGYGLSQWTWYTRKQNLYDRTVKKGKRIDDTYNQLDFLKNELDNGYSKVRTAFNNADKASSDKEGVKLAAKGFLQHFEAPANWSGEVDNRNTYALNAWSEMTGKSATKRNNALSATKANRKLGKGYSGGAGTTTSSTSSLLNNSVSKLKSALSSSGKDNNEKLQEAMVIMVEVLANISTNTANTNTYLSQVVEILSSVNFGTSSMSEADKSSAQQAAASLKKLMADRSNQGYGALQNSDTSYLVEAMTRIARE